MPPCADTLEGTRMADEATEMVRVTVNLSPDAANLLKLVAFMKSNREGTCTTVSDLVEEMIDLNRDWLTILANGG
jgi:hypothetical protein